MLRIGYAKSVPDEGLRSIDGPEPLTRREFAEFIIGRRCALTRWLIRATLSHKGRGIRGHLGRFVVPIRNWSIERAHSRPSRIAHTTSDWPRRMSPAENTLGREVW
jgi:hypothetical protein